MKRLMYGAGSLTKIAFSVVLCVCIAGLLVAAERGKKGKMPLPELPAAPVVPADALALSKECIECHEEAGKVFVGSVHSEKGIQCVVCHGVSTKHVTSEGEMHPERSWRVKEDGEWVWGGDKGPIDIMLFCASCHARPAEGEKDDPAVDLQKLFKGKHGRSALKGEKDVPSCADCHSPHKIHKGDLADDKILNLCGECHSKKQKGFMAGKHAEEEIAKEGNKDHCAECHKQH